MTDFHICKDLRLTVRCRISGVWKAERLAPTDWICKSMCTDVTDTLFCHSCSLGSSVWQAVLAALLH